MKRIMIAAAISIACSFTLLATMTDDHQLETEKMRLAKEPVEEKEWECGEATMIYLVDDIEVDVIKEVIPDGYRSTDFTVMANQAIVNEVLTNLLKNGYSIESVIDVPTDLGCGTKTCIGLTKKHAPLITKMSLKQIRA